jgi:hypothetical protein
MSILDKILTATTSDEVVTELRGIRVALERIAACAEAATTIPEQPPLPDKPLGPEAIGVYGEELNDENTEDIRTKLREEGLSDRQIEDHLVREMFKGGDEE